MNDLSSALQQFKGGDATTITVWRSGKELKLDIVLDAKKPS
jgi:S1-C subfamily serine protease